MKTIFKKYKSPFNQLIMLIGLLSVLSACTDVIQVDLPTGESLLSVDAWITNQDTTYTVKLSKTKNYFDNVNSPKVSGAIVQITDNEGNKETLTESEAGIYKTKTLKGKIGNEYTLRIVAEGETYEAKTNIRPVPPIDSLTYQYENERVSQDLKAGFYVRYFGAELAGNGDYYRIKVYKNGTLFNAPDELIVQSDLFVNGNYIGDLEFQYDPPFQENDAVKVELLSLNEDSYYFFQEMITQINNGGMFANPPANVRTNVKNVNPNSPKKAVGYFGGSAVSKKIGKITGQKGVLK